MNEGNKIFLQGLLIWFCVTIVLFGLIFLMEYFNIKPPSWYKIGW
jgi:hypothetical protein